MCLEYRKKTNYIFQKKSENQSPLKILRFLKFLILLEEKYIINNTYYSMQEIVYLEIKLHIYFFHREDSTALL